MSNLTEIITCPMGYIGACDVYVWDWKFLLPIPIAIIFSLIVYFIMRYGRIQRNNR